MTVARLIARSLCYYWRTGLVVLLGIAVAAAVITGSLLVGDSVTGSLRDTALARLGAIDHALVSPTPFPADLADRLAHDPALSARLRVVAPLLLATGAAQSATSSITIPNVSVIGIDSSFTQCFPRANFPDLSERKVALNAALARDLQVGTGDFLLLTVARQSVIPADTLFASRKRAEATRTLRLQVAAVLPDTGVGGFTLSGGSATPRNLFLSRAWLNAQTGKGAPANVLAVVARTKDEHNLDGALSAALAEQCTLADYGLTLTPHPAQGYLALRSDAMLLNARQLQAAETAARACGAQAQQSSVNLATTITVAGSGRQSAYALLLGADPAMGLADVRDDDIRLDSWLADDLQAHAGDRVDVAYLALAADGSYATRHLPFTVGQVVPLAGAAVDDGLTPTFAGMTDARHIGDWRPPFPIELTRVTPRDEQFWDRFRATPKAFISLNAARQLWARGQSVEANDWVTALRIVPPAGVGVARVARDFPAALQQALPPAQAGLIFRPVRRLAIASAMGTTDFGQLFLAMSIFLVLAAAGLAGMLMRLLADRRATAAGIMLGCGFSPRLVTRAVAGEGIILALGGALLGTPLSLLYTYAIIGLLTTRWSGAVGATTLWPHITGQSLAIGAVSGLVIGIASVLWGTRQLGRAPVLRLLAGWQGADLRPLQRLSARPAWLFVIFLLLAAVLLALSLGWRVISAEAAFFGSGAALLVAGLLGGNLLLLRTGKLRGTPTLAGLAVRNAGANRGRSLLIIGLLASAAFILVTVAANTRDDSHADFTRRDSGTGGFALRAMASLPIPIDFGSPGGRQRLGFPATDEAVFHDVRVMPLLVSPGDDISCLNLARPIAPRLFGVPPAMIARGGFHVLTAGKPSGNPWTLLQQPLADGAIPAFADADSAEWTLHAGLGDTYRMPGPDGAPITVRFVGLLPGSIFAGEVLIAEAPFRRIYPTITAPRAFLIDAPRGRVGAVTDALREQMGDLGLEVRGTREVLNSFLRVQNTYLSTFLALGGLGLLLGTLGMVMVLLRSALERRGEMALLLATGFRRGQVAGLLALEHVGLLTAGLLCGTLSALVAVAPQLVSAATHVQWGTLLGLLAGIFITGVLACVLAGWAGVRGGLLAALREE